MRDSVLVISIRAIPITVRIVRTRIATTRAAPLSPDRRMPRSDLARMGSSTRVIGSAPGGVVTKVDLHGLHPAAVLACRRDLGGVHDHVAGGRRALVRRVGILGTGDQRNHDSVESGAVPRSGARVTEGIGGGYDGAPSARDDGALELYERGRRLRGNVRRPLVGVDR